MDWLLAEMAKDSDGEEGGDGDAAARRNRKSSSPGAGPGAGPAAGSAAGLRPGLVAPPSAEAPSPDVDPFTAAREAWLVEARFTRLSPEAQAAQRASNPSPSPSPSPSPDPDPSTNPSPTPTP